MHGNGVIYTFTVVRQVVRNTAFAGKVPYTVGMVKLDEGPRMIAPIVDSDPVKVRIGARVEVVFEDVAEGFSLPRFKLLK